MRTEQKYPKKTQRKMRAISRFLDECHELSNRYEHISKSDIPAVIELEEIGNSLLEYIEKKNGRFPHTPKYKSLITEELSFLRRLL